ncbi:MAG: hypothetical protein JXA30_14605 [Deltaproteobacteria bacterium]|nr:hypothetical protein [Deltaproteobacteria bacterium]
MSKFLLGFVSASLLWAIAAYAVIEGYVDVNFKPIEVKSDAQEVTPLNEGQKSNLRGRRGKSRRRSSSQSNRTSYRSALTGDSLGEDEVRGIDLVGNSGEQQLTDYEIEQGIDGVFNEIKRCLFLAANEEPVKGRLVLGMRIEGSGRVTKLNLRGPVPVVRGESAGCLRSTIKSIQYRTFNGPAMVVHYPITLE